MSQEVLCMCQGINPENALCTHPLLYYQNVRVSEDTRTNLPEVLFQYGGNGMLTFGSA